MDYSVLSGKATGLIKNLGFQITVTRNGLSVGKAYGVITPSKTEVQEGVTAATPMAMQSKVMYVTAIGSFNPQIGDLVTSTVGQWAITAVSDYKPSTTTIAYRLEIQ
jgi:hypothetical protein